MADLILKINLDASRKKHELIIETYEGIIPNLKSKKFSGQLRKINLFSLFHVDNLSAAELQNVKNIFSDNANTQISQYEYIFSVKKFPCLKNLAVKRLIFCKDAPKSAMYEIEQVLLNAQNEHLECFQNFSAYQDKTTLYISYDAERCAEEDKEIIPLFYMDILSEEYTSELFFDYGKDIVKAGEKDIFLQGGQRYRDYKFENNIISAIKEAHWKIVENKSFAYTGKNIYADIHLLELSGIRLYTNSRKKISVAGLDNISISYGIDWFEVKGTAAVDNKQINLNDLLDFGKPKEVWTEYNGQIIFVPEGLKKLGKIGLEQKADSFKISATDILMALEAVADFEKRNIISQSELLGYQDIELHIPDMLDKTLREYQRLGVKWLLSLQKNGFGGCLADDMGLGKTLQVISYLSDKTLKGNKALIVAPKTLIENWHREFKKFAPDITVYVYHGCGRNFHEAWKFQVIITTFGTLLNDIDEIAKHKFDNLIIDEAQYIKNSRSKAYRAARLVNATTRIILTGTPLENNIREYWGLMKLVNPSNLSYKNMAEGLSERQVIERIKKLTAPFILRRYKKDVLDDLPEKEEKIIYCSFDAAQQNLYNNMLESIRYEAKRKTDRFEIKSNSIVLNGLMYLQEICCHPRLIPREYNRTGCYESAKLDQLLLMLDGLYASGHKIVVFSRFTRMLEIIKKELTKKHFNTFYLDGNTDNRQKKVDEFEKSNDGVFLISLKAGGVGINLVSADTAIIYDPWWNPAVEKQAEDRIYRIGQKNKVTIFKLIAADTIEEKVQILQEAKRKLFDDVIEGHEVPHNISLDDLLY